MNTKVSSLVAKQGSGDVVPGNKKSLLDIDPSSYTQDNHELGKCERESPPDVLKALPVPTPSRRDKSTESQHGHKDEKPHAGWLHNCNLPTGFDAGSTGLTYNKLEKYNSQVVWHYFYSDRKLLRTGTCCRS